MLLPRSHWHNAIEQSPLREGRELYFTHHTGGPNPPPARTNPNNPNPPAGPGNPPSPDARTNPDAAPNAPAAPADTTEAAQNATRGQVEEALQDEDDHGAGEHGAHAEHGEHEHAVPGATEMKKQIDEAFENMHKLRSLIREPAVRTMIKAGSPDEQEQYERILNELEDDYERVALWKNVVDDLAAWSNGDMHPTEFRNLMEEYYRDNEQGPTIMAQLDAYMSGHKDMIDRWGQGNFSNDVEIIADMSQIANLEAIRATIHRQTHNWTHLVHTLEVSLHEVAHADHAHEHHEHGEGFFKGTFNKLGIEFASPLTMWNGLKKVWEAYTEAWQEHQHHLEDAFANKISKTLLGVGVPFSQEADQTLEQKSDSHYNKLKNDYKEFLERDNKKFIELFGEGALMERNMHEPAKAMAVIEFAAAQGWLYDLDEQEGDHILLFGKYDLQHLMPHDWTQERKRNTVRSLRSQNAGGVSEKTDKGKKEMANKEDPEQFTKQITAHMNNLNFWGAIGVIDAFISCEKVSSASVESALAVFEAMRKNSDIRKFLTKSVLERFGFRTFHKAPFTLSAFTMDKKALYAWAQATKNEKETVSLENSGFFGPWLEKIETAVRRKNPDLRGAAFTNAVKEVLTGQVANLGNGQTISIFDPEFNGYRTQNPVSTEFNKPHDMDHDDASACYFAYPSEVIMMSDMYVHHVMTTDSNGGFKQREFAAMLLGQFIKRWKDLQGNRAAQQELENDVRHKLDHAFDEVFNQRHDGLQTVKAQLAQGKLDDKPFLDSLLEKNMISRRVWAKANWNKPKPTPNRPAAPGAPAQPTPQNAA